MVSYRCEAASVQGFIQQLAVAYVGHTYWYYVTGRVPEGKDPRKVDEKLIEKYGVGISKWARARRKRAGVANLHYLRFERFFVLISTRGRHRFFEEEPSFRDIRRDPLKFAGYSVSYKQGVDRKGHPSVRIHPEEYRRLRAYLLELAPHRSVENLSAVFRALPFEPYAPVRRQLLNLHRIVNRARDLAGFEPVPMAALRLRRRVVLPFVGAGEGSRGDLCLQNHDLIE